MWRKESEDGDPMKHKLFEELARGEIFATEKESGSSGSSVYIRHGSSPPVDRDDISACSEVAFRALVSSSGR